MSEISQAVKHKYKMKPGFAAGKYIFQTKEIDLTQVDVYTLEKLVLEGFNIVEEVKVDGVLKPKS